MTDQSPSQTTPMPPRYRRTPEDADRELRHACIQMALRRASTVVPIASVIAEAKTIEEFIRNGAAPLAS